MTQLTFAVEALDVNTIGADSPELIFLDDASYAFVGGGDAVTGY